MSRKIYIIYAIIFVVALGAFAFCLFPGQGAGAFITEKLNGPGRLLSRTSFSMNIGQINPSFPLGLACKKVSIVWDSGRSIPDFSMAMYVPLFSLFKRPVPVEVKACPFDGLARFSLSVPGKNPDTWLLEKIFLDGIKTDDLLYPASGTFGLQGYWDMEFIQKTQVPAKLDAGLLHSMAGQGNIRGRDVKVDLTDSKLSLIALPSLEFSSVQGSFTMADGRVVLTECLFQGEQIHLLVSGQIHLGNSFSQTRLFLDARVLPESPCLAKLAANPLVRMQAPDIAEKGFLFHVTGTLEHPEASL